MLQLPVTFLIPVVKSLSEEAAVREAFLQPYGLATRDLFDIDRKIDWPVFDDLVRASCQVSGNRNIGLRQGELVELRQLGLVAWILMNCQTVDRALALFQRYNAIVCTGIGYELETSGTSLTCRFVNTIPGRHLSRTLMDSILRSFQKLLEQLVGDTLSVQAIALCHADEGDSEEYARTFGVAPQYGQPQYAMRLDREILDRTIVFSDPSLLAQFQAQADLRLAEFPGTAAKTRLQRYLTGRLNGQPTRIADAARDLALGVRTLQAHLKAEGTTYQETVDSVHLAYAQAELRRRNLPVGEIAWILGYSEQSAFQSAFKRWTGMTPLQYRNRN